MPDMLAGAVCVMCERGVHWEAGRVACDGCNLPTDCCLCEPVPAAQARGRSHS